MKYSIMLILAIFMTGVEAITLNPNDRFAVLTWTNPTTYTDGRVLPPGEILGSYLERSDDDGLTWFRLPEENAGPVETYTDTTAIAEGSYLYRVYIIAIGGLVSFPSDTAEVIYYVPKPPMRATNFVAQ